MQIWLPPRFPPSLHAHTLFVAHTHRIRMQTIQPERNKNRNIFNNKHTRDLLPQIKLSILQRMKHMCPHHRQCIGSGKRTTDGRRESERGRASDDDDRHRPSD